MGVGIERPWLNEYEEAALLCSRQAQLARGARSTLAAPDRAGDRRSPVEIAREELRQGCLPCTLRRWSTDCGSGRSVRVDGRGNVTAAR